MQHSHISTIETYTKKKKSSDDGVHCTITNIIYLQIHHLKVESMYFKGMKVQEL